MTITFRRQDSHQVALKSDEMDPHGDGLSGVVAEVLDSVHQVGAKLVSSFKYTQHHDVVVPQVVHDVASETFCPAKTIPTVRGNHPCSVRTHSSIEQQLWLTDNRPGSLDLHLQYLYICIQYFFYYKFSMSILPLVSAQPNVFTVVVLSYYRLLFFINIYMLNNVIIFLIYNLK